MDFNVLGHFDDEQFERQRRTMVVKQLAGRDITDSLVLAAMQRVLRHLFVPEPLRGAAYDDGPQPIGFGQTISQPYVVASMTQHLHLNRTDKVLEVGTGSGYQTAVLAELADEVWTIERVPELYERAARTLKELGYHSVRTRLGDGALGWPGAMSG